MRHMIIAAAAFAILAGAPRATCHGGAHYREAARHAVRLPAGLLAKAAPNDANASVTGLWHVTHTVEGQLLFEALEQWQRGGTEFEFANGAPAVGDICMGTFTKVGPRTYLLYHIGWSFDSDG